MLCMTVGPRRKGGVTECDARKPSSGVKDGELQRTTVSGSSGMKMSSFSLTVTRSDGIRKILLDL